MNARPTWSIILGSLVLFYLGWQLGGFFRINYVIGTLGLFFGFYNLYKEKKK